MSTAIDSLHSLGFLTPSEYRAGDIAISSASAFGSLLLILPFIVSNHWRNKIRHKFIFALGLSDLATAMVVLVQAVHAELYQSPASSRAACQAGSFFYTVSVLTSAIWTGAIGFATFFVLVHPLSAFTAWLSRPWAFWALFASAWFVASLVAGVGTIVYPSQGLGDLCFFNVDSASSKLFGQLVLFVPRALVFTIMIALYVQLFFFLRRNNNFAVASNPNQVFDACIQTQLSGGSRNNNGRLSVTLSKRNGSMSQVSHPRPLPKPKDVAHALKNWSETPANTQALSSGGGRGRRSTPQQAIIHPVRRSSDISGLKQHNKAPTSAGGGRGRRPTPSVAKKSNTNEMVQKPAPILSILSNKLVTSPIRSKPVVKGAQVVDQPTSQASAPPGGWWGGSMNGSAAGSIFGGSVAASGLRSIPGSISSARNSVTDLEHVAVAPSSNSRHGSVEFSREVGPLDSIGPFDKTNSEAEAPSVTSERSSQSHATSQTASSTSENEKVEITQPESALTIDPALEPTMLSSAEDADTPTTVSTPSPIATDAPADANQRPKLNDMKKNGSARSNTSRTTLEFEDDDDFMSPRYGKPSARRASLATMSADFNTYGSGLNRGDKNRDFDPHWTHRRGSLASTGPGGRGSICLAMKRFSIGSFSTCGPNASKPKFNPRIGGGRGGRAVRKAAPEIDNLDDWEARMSGVEMNRQASLLMLLYPTAYLILFSVSLARIIYEFVDKTQAHPLLKVTSKWLILSSGWVDASIFIIVEWQFRSRVQSIRASSDMSNAGRRDLSSA